MAGNSRGISIVHQPTLHRISMEEVEMEDGGYLEGNVHFTSPHLTSYEYGRGKKWNVAGNSRGISILHDPILHRMSMEEVEMECGWQLEGNVHPTPTHLTSLPVFSFIKWPIDIFSIIKKHLNFIWHIC
jgi:hypothetical protein